jgi:hypothetical protein
MIPNQEWGFTARPDFARICRELAQTGCAVGLVSMEGEKPVTLIDVTQAGVKVPAGQASAAVAGTLGRWRVVAGDLTKAALDVRPVRVEGFKPDAIPGSFAPGVEPTCTPTERRTLNRLAALRAFTTRHLESTWTQADGAKVRVQGMSDSHLHYALAKAYRNEYGTSIDRLTGIDALKAEAARRLLAKWLEDGTPAKHSGPFVAMDLETQTVKPAQTSPPTPIGRVVSYDPGSARISLFGTSGRFDFKTSGTMPPYRRWPFDR